jgi:hypothetical protein
MTKNVDGKDRPAVGVKHTYEDEYVVFDEFNVRMLNRLIADHKKDHEER